MELMEILKGAVEKKASDIFIISGLAVTYKENGIITKQNDNMILPAEAERLIKEIYRLAGRDISRYEETGDDDFSVSVKGLSRFRISAYKQRGSMAAVIRVVEFDIPDYNELNIPQEVITDTVARTKGASLYNYRRLSRNLFSFSKSLFDCVKIVCVYRNNVPAESLELLVYRIG